jgi:hypothetical protein
MRFTVDLAAWEITPIAGTSANPADVLYWERRHGMEAAQATGKTLGFEEVWAIVQENARGIKELRESIREGIRESRQEAEKRMKESQAEAEKRRQEEAERRRQEDERRRQEDEKQKQEDERRRQEDEKRRQEDERRRQVADREIQEIREIQRETAEKIGKLGSRFGEMIEYMVKPNLVKKFREMGFEFTKVYQDTNIKDEKNEIITEIDFTLENGDKVMVVEVKSKPSVGDIRRHTARMGILRKYADLHGDARKYLGAVAGMVVNENERNFALKSGFYVITPSGNTFNIIEPSGEYRPREW